MSRTPFSRLTAPRSASPVLTIKDLSRSTPQRPLPDGFLFGVATAAFQVEGGINGPGEPANNWALWEAAGKVEPSGIAIDFWNRYEHALDKVAEMGCNCFRMGIEWARVEPEEGEIDEAALAHYQDILDACKARGLEPVVTLHHFTHPHWLGPDFWLQSDSPERFVAWTKLVHERFKDSCRLWITLNEANLLPAASYIFGMFPPGRRGALAMAGAALDHMVAAHIKAYHAIHTAQPNAVVSLNEACASLYEMDRMMVDFLLSRSHGISQEDIGSWLREGRERFYGELPPPSKLEATLRTWSAKVARGLVFDPQGAASKALFEGPQERPMDAIQLDYYDPVSTNHVSLPGRKTAGGRTWWIGRDLWDDAVNPEGLVTYLRAGHEPGLPLWIVENGICNRVVRGRAFPRLDGWDRRAYLKANLAAMARAVDAGLPVQAYIHWTLADNYEWGSYQPRFGIYGIDRERGVAWLDHDSFGDDAAGTYKRCIEALSTGEREKMLEA